MGIIGITVSPSNPDNLYAIVEAEKGGVFRSRDAGQTWTRVNEERELRQRAWYYSRIYADPASIAPGTAVRASRPSPRPTATTTTCGSLPRIPCA